MESKHHKLQLKNSKTKSKEKITSNGLSIVSKLKLLSQLYVCIHVGIKWLGNQLIGIIEKSSIVLFVVLV